MTPRLENIKIAVFNGLQITFDCTVPKCSLGTICFRRRSRTDMASSIGYSRPTNHPRRSYVPDYLMKGAWRSGPSAANHSNPGFLRGTADRPTGDHRDPACDTVLSYRSERRPAFDREPAAPVETNRRLVIFKHLEVNSKHVQILECPFDKPLDCPCHPSPWPEGFTPHHPAQFTNPRIKVEVV